MAHCNFLFLIALLVIGSLNQAAPASSNRPVRSGTAAFNSVGVTSVACGGSRDLSPMVAGVSLSMWDEGRSCGRKLEIQCTGSRDGKSKPCKSGSVVVTVNDFCGNCNATMVVSQEAFSTIADLDAGIVKVSIKRLNQGS